MVRSLRVTLYEIFGYLLPGMMVLVSLAVLGWACWWPATPLKVGEWSMTAVFGAGIVAYALGHIAQAIGNAMDRWRARLELEESDDQVGSLLIDVRERVAATVGIATDHLSQEWLSRILDQRLAATGCVDDRDLFAYREGYYRGTTVAYAMLGIALLVRAVVPGTVIAIDSVQVEIPCALLGLAGLGSVACTALSFRRWQRFGRYRLTTAVAAFLAGTMNDERQERVE